MVTSRGLPPEIQDLDDYTESKNILVYGVTGTGKTVMAGKLPKALFLATENGTIAAKRQGSKAKVWPIHHWNDLVKAYEWLAAHPTAFDWIVIDSVTDMQVKCIRAIMENVVKNNKSRDPDIPAIQDHYKWQLSMKRMISDFNELPVNIFWTAQEMVREDPEGEDIILPLIEGKDYQISAWACAQMHVVANLHLKKLRNPKTKAVRVVRRLVCNQTPPYYAKDRYDVLGDQIDDPDINEMVRKIDASETGRPTRTVTRRTATKKATNRRRSA